ncbi:MAG TPA: thioesterase family protein [Caulobacteraceae bacterium]|jgi:acyl-CoA thioester hydrolase
MRLLHESEIKPTEIDHLGHMNVRFYMDRAQRANKALMASFGLDKNALASGGARLVQKDSYIRYHREQFQGSTLEVRGGVLQADASRLQLYFELVNDAKAQVAATFIMSVSLVDRATRADLPVPEAALAAAADERVTMPEHGRPRTIDLGAPRLDIVYEELAERLSDEHSDPMSRRMQRTIKASECDEFGFLAESRDMMFGGFRMPRPEAMREAERSFGPMTFVSDDGHRFGWASLETRNVQVEQPRAGDTICSIGAEIGLHSKVRHSRRWMFNTTTGRLVSLNDNVSVGLDLDARRTIEIPPKLRTVLESRHFPEFA